MRDRLLIYGANGYTGELIASLAVERQLRPLLAGRSAEAIGVVARALQSEARVFGLDDPRAVDAGLADAAVVLHCAGPFSHTSRPMADACLRAGAHYLDITGEAVVFECVAARDVEAKAAGVMLLPGTGFDVVPSDCLAAHLKRRLPEATRLALGFQPSGRVSRGTATTMIENLHKGGLIRKGGVLTRVPPAYKTRSIDFGRGPRKAMTIPWGDVATAYYSTGIGEIEVYASVAPHLILGLKLARPFMPLLANSAVQRLLKARVRSGAPGPTPEERERGYCLLWGEAEAASGARVVSRMRTGEGYAFTALAAVASAERVLRGGARPGFMTPSLAFGPDFALEIPGVTREDL